MDGKSIVVGLELDTKEITKQLSEFQNKIKGMRNVPSNIVQGDSPRDMQMKQAFQRSEGMYRDKLIKQYETQDKIINELLKKENELNQKMKEKIKDAEKLNQLQQEYLQTTQAIRQGVANQQGISETMCPPGHRYDPATKQCVPDGTGGGGGGGGFFGGGPMDKMKGLMGAVGSIAAVAKSMTDMADFINRRRGEYSAERSASLAESMYAPSRRAIRGENLDDILFAEERNKAFKSSMDMGEGQFGINRGKAVGSGIAGTAGIGLGIAALLAAPFTGGASLALAAAGAGAGLMAGGGYALSANKGMGYEAMFGDMGEVDKMTGQQIMTNYKKQIAKEKAQDPVKTMLKEFISENIGDITRGLRGSGMSEQDYLRNYVQGYGLAGVGEFGFKQQVGMTNQMLQAGGGSGAAYGQNMVTALQAQRSLGLTNAGQTMGRLSNYLNAQESEEAFVKILGKGVSIGLDKSQFREEQKDYFNQVTAIAQNIGAGEALVSSIMTAAIGGEGDISRKNVQFAADAAKDIMSDMGKSTGRIGAQKYRNINKNPMFSGLSREDRFFLGKINPADINPENEELQYYYDRSGAKEKGISQEQFAEELKKEFASAITSGFGEMSSDTEKDRQTIENLTKKQKSGKELTEEELKQLRDARVRATRNVGFATDREGTYEKRKKYMQGLLFGTQEKGKEKDFTSRVGEYQQLKYNEKFLDEDGKKRLKELEGTTAAFRGRPEGGTEGALAAANLASQQERQARTEDGKDLAGVMSDFAKNLDEALSMSVKERALLKGFQKALEDGAEEVVKAMVMKINGSARGLSKVSPMTAKQHKATSRPGGMGGAR